MKILMFLMISLMSWNLMATEQACNNENLAVFFVGQQQVQPEKLIGDDPCRDFGGAYIRTPKYQIPVYVNYNIPVTIHLEDIDQAIETFTPNEFYLNELKQWQVNFVSRERVNRFPENKDYRVKAEKNLKSYYISTRIFDENRKLSEVWQWIYDPNYQWQE